MYMYSWLEVQMEAKWNYEELLDAVKNSISIAQVLTKLGLKPQGANYKTMHSHFKKHNIDTTHFLGKSHFKGQKRPNLKRNIQELLIKNDSNIQTNKLKKRLIEEKLLQYNCSICNISNWLGNELALHLDHINGDSFDNRLDNLRLLCPNCHSQTSTYCGKKNRLPRRRCLNCKNELQLLTSTRCVDCENHFRLGKNTKIDWLPTTQLILLIKEIGYVQAGKQLNVSGNAIKKRIRNHPND